MKNVILIIQARMGSTRLPGKVLLPLNGKPVLKWILDRTSSIKLLTQTVIATSRNNENLEIINFASKNNTKLFQGDEDNVLKRFYECALASQADIVVRVTADCPLIDPNIIEQLIYKVKFDGYDYASNVLPPSWPDGLDCEVFTMNALQEAYFNAKKTPEKEHVTPYIYNNQNQFRIYNLISPDFSLSRHRWTLDTEDDHVYLSKVCNNIDPYAKTWEILDYLQSHYDLECPVLRERNYALSQNIEVKIDNFDQSNALLKRAKTLIPLGSQTFSKSYLQFPSSTFPGFLSQGIGAKIRDVNGNEYVDFINGLASIVLGYNDPDVNQAIIEQLSKGISFSLSTDLEIQLAEKICMHVPSAEMVRFAKNGTDATSAAVRIARAYTSRDKVAVCGYHGWQDWYIGTTTRNKGVPIVVSELTSPFVYNNLNELENKLRTEQFACVVMEPCNFIFPEKGYLESVKQLCERYGTLLVFDEVVTGFRFALGGAQSYFGVTPHLSCIGKAMGNGMPISAIVGQREYMKEVENIFFSGTFGGESLSIAAALATVNKIEKNDVCSYLWNYGAAIRQEILKIIDRYDLGKTVRIKGYDIWMLFEFLSNDSASQEEMKTFFLQSMIQKGVLIGGVMNLSYSHGDFEKAVFLKAFDYFCEQFSSHLSRNTLASALPGDIIKPVFSVR